jgi:Fe-S-cluster containining protein
MSSSCLCDQCSALCCRYFVLEIDAPETRRAYDDIRWYLVHENVFVFIEKRKWYLGIYSRCKHLQPDNRCGIYETRPTICRSYSTDNCDYHGGDYDWDVLFSSAEQLEQYGKEKLAEAREKEQRRKKREMRAEKQEQGAKAATGNGVKPKLSRTTTTTRKNLRRPPKLPRLRPGMALGSAMGLGTVTGGLAGNGKGGGRAAASVRSLPVLPR